MKTFTDKVLNIVKKIPKGQTMSYKEVAQKAGNINASRVVGNIMENNFRPDVPCHRVICSNGKIGEYNRGGVDVKKALLKREGVSF